MEKSIGYGIMEVLFMKKNKLIWGMLTALLTFGLVLTSCADPINGDPGAPGENGTNGNNGTDGTNGTDGNNGTDGSNGSNGLTAAGPIASTLAGVMQYFDEGNTTVYLLGNATVDAAHPLTIESTQTLVVTSYTDLNARAITETSVGGITVAANGTLTNDGKLKFLAGTSFAANTDASISAITGHPIELAAGVTLNNDTVTVLKNSNAYIKVGGGAEILLSGVSDDVLNNAATLADAWDGAIATGPVVALTSDVTAGTATVPAEVTLFIPSGKTLTVNGILTVNGDLDGDGEVVVDGASASIVAASMPTAGTLTMKNGGTVSVADYPYVGTSGIYSVGTGAEFEIKGNSDSGTSYTVKAGTVTVNGTSGDQTETIGANDTLTVAPGATLVIASAATLKVDSTGAVTVAATGSLNVNGTISLTSADVGGGNNGTITVSNTGTILDIFDPLASPGNDWFTKSTTARVVVNGGGTWKTATGNTVTRIGTGGVIALDTSAVLTMTDPHLTDQHGLDFALVGNATVKALIPFIVRSFTVGDGTTTTVVTLDSSSQPVIGEPHYNFPGNAALPGNGSAIIFKVGASVTFSGSNTNFYTADALAAPDNTSGTGDVIYRWVTDGAKWVKVGA
jgi:hypothetical protein